MSASDSIRANLVIGGGLAGATAALRLSEAGRDVVLLEKEPRAHHKVCGEFLSAEALEYLRQGGVDPVRLGAAPIDKLRFAVGRRVIATELPFRALAVSRCVLDEALMTRAAEVGCELRRGVTVQTLVREHDAWTAQLGNGTTQRARNVFLATGKHDLRAWSRPAGTHGDLVGFKMHWRLRAEQIQALRGFMELFLFQAGYGGLTLVENETANLCLVVRRSRLRELGGWGELLASLSNQNGLIGERLAGALPLWDKPLAISSIPYGYLCANVHGVWPLGDQAAVIPSFTGDGMSIALHSAALAAEMYLNGKTTNEYQRTLHGQLRAGMSLATFLSRAMISGPGRLAAPFALAAVPKAIPRIAAATRIPAQRLRRTNSAQAQA